MKIRLKSVKNIRDFSEYGCKGNIRSAHLNELSPSDMEILTSRYALKTVIDLRTEQEVSEKPDVPIPGVRYIHIPIFSNAVPGVSHERETDSKLDEIPDMPTFYRLLVTEDCYLKQIKKVLAQIEQSEREGAVLWHCTEGKDRCGLISALYLLSHGVSREDVMKDYLCTNRTNFGKAWRYYILVYLSTKNGAMAAKVRDAFLARREYLEPIMDALVRLSDNAQA